MKWYIFVFITLVVQANGDPLTTDQDAWKAIFDHWDLGTKGVPTDCRLNPCNFECGDFLCHYNNNGMFTIHHMSIANKLAGTIPKELGQLMSLDWLNISENELTGNIPKELGQLTSLTYLGLKRNKLSGSIPKELGQLTSLNTRLDLSENELTGAIPKELGQLISLTGLGLSSNDLDYPPPEEIYSLCSKIRCQFLPPRSCRAFGDSVELSVDLQSCVKCTQRQEVIVIIFVVIGMIMILAVRKLLQLIKKYPGSVGGTVSSISIVMSHAQMMSVVSRMDLSWPVPIEHTRDVLNVFYGDLPGAVQAECLLRDTHLILWGWVCIFGIFVTLLFVPSCLKRCALCCCKDSRDHRVDSLYNGLGFMLSFLAIAFTNAALGFYTLMEGIGQVMYVSIISTFLLYIFFKFFREMRVMQGKWDGAMCRRCCPEKCCSCCCFLKPVTLSKERLQTRLNYLTKRFGVDAPYWQFVIWFRQISLILLGYSVKDTWLLAFLAIIVCLLSLGLHVRTIPYKYDFQNEVDKWLLIANVVIVLAGVIYSEVLKPNIQHDNVWSWIVTAVVLLSMFGSLLGAVVYLRLWKTFLESFKEMRKDTGVANGIEMEVTSDAFQMHYVLLSETDGQTW